MKSGYKFNVILLLLFSFCLIILLLSGNNKALFIEINSSASYCNPFIWANLTFLGDTLPACGIMLLFIRKRPDMIWSGIIATVFATIIVNLMKFYFNLPRPPAVLDKNIINIIGPALSSHSFPSGHTVTIFTLTAILMFYFRKLIIRLLLISMACLVALSRIAVGVHWPSDVLAGAVVGILCAIIGTLIVTKLEWNNERSIQLVVGFLLILSNIYLLIFYNSRYDQALYLQTVLAGTVLVAGLREYYLLFNND
jgi:membrane-associated phospholipid phosphatase